MRINWPTNAEESAYMAMRQQQNRVSCLRSYSERWMLGILEKTGHTWTRQARWGYRLFDFWCCPLGVAVEVDGPEHKQDYDSYRDEYIFRRSGIVVLRVPNRDEAAASRMLLDLGALGPHGDRKEVLGISGNTKKERRSLLSQPQFPYRLPLYLEELRLK